MAEALAPLGDKGREITAYLIGFVDKMSAGALGAVGLVTLFLTVLSLMGIYRGSVQPYLASARVADIGTPNSAII